MIEFGRTVTNSYDEAVYREWLITNGIGGYASGTVAGTLSRRYHGLLVAALKPPLERTLLVSKFDESVNYAGTSYPLFTNQWQDGTVEPEGYKHIERFHLDSTTPIWNYAFADVQIEKRIWMQQKANTTFIRYDLNHASGPVTLTIKALVNYRDHHSNTLPGKWQMKVRRVENGLCIIASDHTVPFYLLGNGIEITPQDEWYENYYLSIENYRGLDFIERNLYVGNIRYELLPGENLTLVISTEPSPILDGITSYQEKQAYDQEILSKTKLTTQTPEIQQLVLAANQFIVNRTSTDNPEGKSIIAGYPWFGDWGRDTMIALPGLTLSTGRPEIARNILRTYAQYVDQGMLPNRFPEIGKEPEYNTVDATLWYFEALRAYWEDTKDINLLAELFPVLQEIIAWHKQGTRYNIKMDQKDGLLYAGDLGVQLTWMDAKVEDWVVTPRIGKPVEINALWLNALRIMAEFAEKTGVSGHDYSDMAKQVAQNFPRFWNELNEFCFDLIDGPDGDDPALRPNQLFAVSLPHSPLAIDQQRAIVDACTEMLLTPHGLRSLSPEDEEYIGVYGGDQLKRDRSYHQGTTWGWLIGTYIQAHLKVYKDPELAKSYLQPLIQQLFTHGVGSISEIFDGDPPFTPRGCFAQAWSVAELLRAWKLIERDIS